MGLKSLLQKMGISQKDDEQGEITEASIEESPSSNNQGGIIEKSESCRKGDSNGRNL